MNYSYVIVEDEATARRGIELKMRLAQLPFELVGVASNGREGLALIRSAHPDLAIMDIQMPEMDGLALMEAVRREGLNVEIIIVSGYSSFEYARLGIRTGVCGYLLKPFSEKELGEAVQRAMQHMREKGVAVPEGDANVRQEEIRLLRDELMGVRSFLSSFAFSELNIDAERGVYMVLEIVRTEDYIAPSKPQGLDELVCIDVTGVPNREYVVAYARNGISDAVRSRLLEQLHGIESIGVSQPCIRLQEARRQAQTARRDHPIRARGTVTLYQAPPGPKPMESAIQDLLIFALENGDAGWFKSEFTHYYNRCAELGRSVNDFLGSVRLFFQCAIDRLPASESEEKPMLVQFDYLAANCSDDAQLPEVIQRFITKSFHGTQAGGAVQSIYMIRQYIDTHFAEELSQEYISSLFNVSPTYISRMFSRYFDTTYSNYIATQRIKHSCELLRETEIDVEKIGTRCGFGSAKYFYKVFRQHLGCTPSQYRQHIQRERPEA